MDKMKRIKIAGLCLVAMFAVSGIAAGSASAYTYPWVCALMPVTPQTVYKNEAGENKEGYFKTPTECAEHGPSFKGHWREEPETAELLKYAGTGPWVNVEREKGHKVGKWECRHLARPTPPGEGEPGTYWPGAECKESEFVEWEWGIELESSYDLVVPPVKCEKAVAKVEKEEANLAAAEKTLKEAIEKGASSKTIAKDEKTVKKDKEKLAKAVTAAEKACIQQK